MNALCSLVGNRFYSLEMCRIRRLLQCILFNEIKSYNAHGDIKPTNKIQHYYFFFFSRTEWYRSPTIDPKIRNIFFLLIFLVQIQQLD